MSISSAVATPAWAKRGQESPGQAFTSRVTEYEALTQQVQLRSEVLLQPLRREHVEVYLDGAGEKLSAVRAALLADDELWDLAESPVMLSMLSLA